MKPTSLPKRIIKTLIVKLIHRNELVNKTRVNAVDQMGFFLN